jgi:hypothetical protein
LLTDRRVAIAVVLGITAVFALAGWRYLSGESQAVSTARVPVVAAAKPQALVGASDASASLNQLDLSQQLLVDDLQLLQGRVAAQDTEIKRLRNELQALSQKYETLSSFASTVSAAKEVKPEPSVQPPKKKKKRFVKRSKKRGNA